MLYYNFEKFEVKEIISTYFILQHVPWKNLTSFKIKYIIKLQSLKEISCED